jgi:hypothetical protein
MIMTPVNRTHYPLLESAVQATADFFGRLMRRYRAMQELRNIGENQAAMIARDLGVSQTELRSLATRDPEFPKLLKKMLWTLWIDERVLQEANPTLLRDMQKVCAFCQNTRRCRRELDAESASEHFHDYCPNAPNLYSAANYRRLPDRRDDIQQAM